MRVCISLVLLLLCGCGLEQEVATDVNPSGGDQANLEDAVFIRKVSENNKGVRTQCRLNSILISDKEDIVVFIEFEGEEIQRSVFKNSKAPINFGFFNPGTAGYLICVIQYANAEFESDPLWVEPH